MASKTREATVGQLVSCKREAEKNIEEVIKVEMKKFENKTGLTFRGIYLEFQVLTSMDGQGLESHLQECSVEVAI